MRKDEQRAGVHAPGGDADDAAVGRHRQVLQALSEPSVGPSSGPYSGPIQALSEPFVQPRQCPSHASSPLIHLCSLPPLSPCSLRRPPCTGPCTTRPVSDDVGRLRNKNTKGDAVMLRGYAKKYFSHIIKLLGRYGSICTRDRVVWLSTPF